MRPAALRSVVAGAVLSLGAGLLAALPAAAAPAPRVAAVDQALRIGTYNIRAGVSQAEFEGAVSAVKPQVDVLGLQEIGATDRGTYLAADSTWGYYRPPALQQNPILWDRALFDFAGAKGYLIAEKRDLGGEHSGDEAKGDSWATVVRLVQRATGQQLSFVNVHLVRGAVKGGLPAPDRPKLFRLYTDQVSGTVAAIKAERAVSDEVFVLGDFNVGWEADFKRKHKKLPFKRFKGINLRSMWQGSPLLPKSYGTHNDALIDQVWSTRDSSSEAILRGIKASDHWPAVATYQLPVDPGHAAPTGSIGFHQEDLVQSAKERDGKTRDPDLAFRLTGNLAHGFAGFEYGGDADRALKYGQGDYLVDMSELYDDDLDNATIYVDFQGDEKYEGDETFTITLVDPSGTTIMPGHEAVTGTILDDD